MFLSSIFSIHFSLLSSSSCNSCFPFSLQLDFLLCMFFFFFYFYMFSFLSKNSSPLFFFFFIYFPLAEISFPSSSLTTHGTHTHNINSNRIFYSNVFFIIKRCRKTHLQNMYFFFFIFSFSLSNVYIQRPLWEMSRNHCSFVIASDGSYIYIHTQIHNAQGESIKSNHYKLSH